MRKICTLVLLITMGFIKVNAQTMCDTINSPIASNWTATAYTYNTFFGSSGYLSGVNEENYTQQANYFNLSGTSNAYILGTAVKFSKANSNVPGDLLKNVIFRLYNDDAGKPGTEITTALTIAQVSLSKIKADVAAGVNTNIDFPSAIALPATKKFYVAVDLTNFQWFSPDNIRDSICITTTADNQTVNNAWGFDGSKWKAYNKDWFTPPLETEPLDATLYIFPLVSNTASGCTLLPVQLLSFNAERKANDVQLNWQISDEINMKGYEIEKAGNNGVYSTVAFVKAYNSLKNQQYSFTDKNAFAIASSIQYRLKQIDADGSINYSRVIALNTNAALTDAVFANPFSGALKLQLNLATQQTVSLKMHDMQGRLVAAQTPAVYGSSASSINFISSAKLKPGAYLLQLNVGNEQKVYKVVKQ